MPLSKDELSEFATECFDLLQKAEDKLLALDSGEPVAENYDAIFRVFHNIKGASGMMELHELQAHMHKLENILTEYKGAASIPKDKIELFLRGIDAIKKLLNGESIQFNYGDAMEEADSAQAKPEKIATVREFRDSSVGEFFVECDEIVVRIHESIEKMVKHGASQELVDEIYRDIHSLKGGAFLMGYSELGELSHAIENCLEYIKESKITVSAKLTDAIYRGVDLIEKILESGKSGSQQNFANDIKTLVSFFSDYKTFTKVEVKVPQLETVKLVETAKIPTQEIQLEPEKQEIVSSIRVPVSLLDKLMALVGEMVLVRNQVIQYSNKSDDLEFLNLSQRLNVVTGEIQGEMMKTRMQPIGNVLSKFQRVVRDLAKELGKKIDLHIEGSETELDKTLLEAIKDPLTHIIRNSCDHGIESLEERKAKGKSENGSIHVRSYHEGGQVIVEIVDDGKGLHRDRLIAKALEKKLITQEKADSISDRDAMNLIFAPGFSTASKVTNVSGRGVGMDVVKSNIDRIGGRVDLESTPNKGTTIRLKIPLTLAIVPAMIIRTAEDRYAIPQIKLSELVRVEKGDQHSKIEYLQGKPVLRLRGNLLPLLDLKAVLDFDGHSTQKYTEEAEAINIVVLNSDGKFFGLIVDEIQDTADIVVKPLSQFLKSLAVYSGATVLGDGTVALILDIAGMAAQHLDLSDDAPEKIKMNSLDQKMDIDELQEFLLFNLNSPTKHSMFLGYVHRLEEFKKSAIEYSGGQRVVRYRDSILPILNLNSVLGYEKEIVKDTDIISVIVTQKNNRCYGIEVNEILDVLSTEKSIDPSVCDRAGFLGYLSKDKEVIVMIDPFQCLINSASGGGSQTSKAHILNKLDQITSMSLKSASQKRILFVEDTAFFRKHVAGVLERAGYEVTMKKNGEEAIAELEAKGVGHYGLLLSDIEMPKLNGYDLATTIRKDKRWNALPLVALTTKFSAKDLAKGKAAGFNAYIEKLNADELLSAIDQLGSSQEAA